MLAISTGVMPLTNGDLTHGAFEMGTVLCKMI
jgi:hypothetical protein